MSHKLQWGLIGTGRIARAFANSLKESRLGELAAIGSRSMESAHAFAADFPAVCHGSYEALLADPRVQAVYISTPHPAHAQWAIKAAEAGKHILCEKPMTMSHAEALAVVEAARRHNVFLMEAFMYRCQPQTQRLAELIRERVIGDVLFIRASFGFRGEVNPESRVFNRELGGGGILDVGAYTVSMVRLIAGAANGALFENPLEIKASGVMGSTNVDDNAIASLKFSNGILAQIATGVRMTLDNNVQIIGSEGSLLVPNPWFCQGAYGGHSKLIIFKEGIPEEVLIECGQGIYTVEADHVAEMIAQGRRESPYVSWDDTMGNMAVIDEWRRQVES